MADARTSATTVINAKSSKDIIDDLFFQDVKADYVLACNQCGHALECYATCLVQEADRVRADDCAGSSNASITDASAPLVEQILEEVSAHGSPLAIVQPPGVCRTQHLWDARFRKAFQRLWNAYSPCDQISGGGDCDAPTAEKYEQLCGDEPCDSLVGNVASHSQYAFPAVILVGLPEECVASFVGPVQRHQACRQKDAAPLLSLRRHPLSTKLANFFRLGEFVPEGSTHARVSAELVACLDRVRKHLGYALAVTSAYTPRDAPAAAPPHKNKWPLTGNKPACLLAPWSAKCYDCSYQHDGLYAAITPYHPQEATCSHVAADMARAVRAVCPRDEILLSVLGESEVALSLSGYEALEIGPDVEEQSTTWWTDCIDNGSCCPSSDSVLDVLHASNTDVDTLGQSVGVVRDLSAASRTLRPVFSHVQRFAESHADELDRLGEKLREPMPALVPSASRRALASDDALPDVTSVVDHIRASLLPDAVLLRDEAAILYRNVSACLRQLPAARALGRSVDELVRMVRPAALLNLTTVAERLAVAQNATLARVRALASAASADDAVRRRWSDLAQSGAGAASSKLAALLPLAPRVKDALAVLRALSLKLGDVHASLVNYTSSRASLRAAVDAWLDGVAAPQLEKLDEAIGALRRISGDGLAAVLNVLSGAAASVEQLPIARISRFVSEQLPMHQWRQGASEWLRELVDIQAVDGTAGMQRLFEFVRELTTKTRNLIEAFDAGEAKTAALEALDKVLSTAPACAPKAARPPTSAKLTPSNPHVLLPGRRGALPFDAPRTAARASARLDPPVA
eukprot:3215834-Prymnesium_polylepis.2